MPLPHARSATFSLDHSAGFVQFVNPIWSIASRIVRGVIELQRNRIRTRGPGRTTLTPDVVSVPSAGRRVVACSHRIPDAAKSRGHDPRATHGCCRQGRWRRAIRKGQSWPSAKPRPPDKGNKTGQSDLFPDESEVNSVSDRPGPEHPPRARTSGDGPDVATWHTPVASIFEPVASILKTDSRLDQRLETVAPAIVPSTEAPQ